MERKTALLVVDMQNDFCPGGALAVAGGDQVVPVLNEYIELFSKRGLPVFFSRDWHPEKTKHFKKFGGVWPAHCVQGTKGAQFHPRLKIPREAIIISKGADPEKDSYSAFQAVDESGKDLRGLFMLLGIDTVFIGGLAADYCVKFSVLDALKSGRKTYLCEDAVKGVNLRPEDTRESLAEMVKNGARLIRLEKARKILAGV